MEWLMGSRRNRTLEIGRLTVVIAGFIGLICTLSCSNNHSFKVTRSGNSVHVDLQTLSEYPTTIVHVRVSNQKTKTTIWEIKAKSGTPQLHGLTLREGENPSSLADPDSGTYAVLVPLESQNFRLQHGIVYEIEVWKNEQSGPSRASFEFED
jgi:hypothetical protein